MFGHRIRRGSQYHLEFVTGASTREFKDRLKATLNKIYKSDCPLKRRACRTAQSHGRQVIQVRFCLSRRSKGHTLETAGRDLCERLFAAENRRAIAELTRESILGVSASCKEWRRWFLEALFSGGLVQGSEFLEDLNKEASTSDCFQEWLLVFSYAVFAGLNLSLFATGVVNASEAAVGLLLAPDSAELLERYIKVNQKHKKNIQSEWESSVSAFNRSCAKTIKAIKAYTARGKSGKRLRDKLFDLVKHCGELTTSNEEVLEIMKGARAASLNAVLARAGSVAGAAAIIGSTITSSTVVTGVGIAPLSTWLASGPLLVETATMLGCAAPPLAVVCAVIGIWHLKKMTDEKHKLKRWDKDVAYCEKLKILIVTVWNVVAETDAFLVWARCTQMKRPRRRRTVDTGVDGSEDDTREAMARQRIREFFRSREAHGAKIPRDASLRHVIVKQYIDERRYELESMQEDLTKTEYAVRRSLKSRPV